MGRTSAASRYGYKRFKTLRARPVVPYPLSPKKMMAYEAKEAAWWREWTEYSPTLTPDTVLTEGEWCGQTAQTALRDPAFTRWLYRLPHTSGEARGLLKLLLKTEIASVDRRRVAQRRWRLVLWSIRLRNALWAASERRSVARAAYVDPHVERFRVDCMAVLAR